MSDAPNDLNAPPIPVSPVPVLPAADPGSNPAATFNSSAPERAAEAPSPPATVADLSPAPIEWQPVQSLPVQSPPESPSPTESSPRATETPSIFAPGVAAPSVSRLPLPVEPLAQEPARVAATTNPLLAMLFGAVLACALLGSGILIGRSGRSSDDVMVASPMNSSSNISTGVSSSSGNAIVRAVAEVGPAVMNVDTTFGKTDSDVLPNPGQEGPRAGKGTGFVIDSKRGLMLTNAHVVAGAAKIQVKTRDGKTYTGRVMGFDRQSDIAVVILDNKSLPQAKLAGFKDARELPIGDWAIAIGNPFAQENTVTVGVLSAVGRTLPVPANEHGEGFALTDMMQTDAAINPGNSGGPLCNLRGEVIGINTAIIPFGQGLGFTIPINKAKSIADQIIKNGKVLHPYIGVSVKPVTDALQSDYGLPDKNGALVQNIEPNSPAAKSGLQPGDVIRKLDGQNMKSSEEVVKTIGSKKVGDSIRIEVLRNNSIKKTLTLKIGDRPN